MTEILNYFFNELPAFSTSSKSIDFQLFNKNLQILLKYPFMINYLPKIMNRLPSDFNPQIISFLKNIYRNNAKYQISSKSLTINYLALLISPNKINEDFYVKFKENLAKLTNFKFSYLNLLQYASFRKTLKTAFNLKIKSPLLTQFLNIIASYFATQAFTFPKEITLFSYLNKDSAQQIFNLNLNETFTLPGFQPLYIDKYLSRIFINYGYTLMIKFPPNQPFLANSINMDTLEFYTYPNGRYKLVDKFIYEKNIFLSVEYLDNFEEKQNLIEHFDFYFLHYLNYLLTSEKYMIVEIYQRFYQLYRKMLKNHQKLFDLYPILAKHHNLLHEFKIVENVYYKQQPIDWLNLYNYFLKEIARKNNNISTNLLIKEEEDLFLFRIQVLDNQDEYFKFKEGYPLLE